MPQQPQDKSGGVRRKGGKADMPAAAAKKSPAGLDQQLLEGLQETNRAFQGQQVEQLKQMYQSPKGGVEAQKAY
jgi:hypothetical protein